jgi:hypothetical protein
VTVHLPPLTLALFHEAATTFAIELGQTPLPHLYGATDGKAVGTAVEAAFKAYLQERFNLAVGNAASGLDFPTLDTDLKVTSLRQPQSSCPFKAATQKIYGLGYNLLVVVYNKRDEPGEQAAYLDIHHVIYIDKARTGDFTLTKMLREIVARSSGDLGGRDGAVDDIDALLEDKNVPLDEVSRRQLAERIVDDVPEQGVLTISNALQWRLQYSRAISTAVAGQNAPEVMDLRAK